MMKLLGLFLLTAGGYMLFNVFRAYLSIRLFMYRELLFSVILCLVGGYHLTKNPPLDDQSFANQNDQSENIFSDKNTSIINGSYTEEYGYEDILISNTTKNPVTGFYRGLWTRGIKFKWSPDYCEGNFIEGKKDGLWKLYIKGKLHGEGQYKDGLAQGTWKYYWPNGQIRLEGKLIENKRDGLWIGYGEDGNIKFEGKYVLNKKTGLHTDWYDVSTFSGYYYVGSYSDDKRDGLFKGYFENGQLERELLYDNGKVLSTRCFNASGYVIPCED